MEDAFHPFVQTSVAVNITFLSFFEQRLGPTRGELTRMHDLDRINGEEARCTRTPPRQQTTGIGAHTDFGSLVSSQVLSFLQPTHCCRPLCIIVSEGCR